MKKLLALVLVLTLVLSMGVGAFATGGPDPDPEYEDFPTIQINKNLDRQGLNPAETFYFEIGEGSGLRDNVEITAPDFDQTIFSITVAQGAEDGSANIDLPTFTQVGVYTYPITETEGNTAGFDYDNGEYNLVITVINNPAFGEEGEPEFLRVLTLTDGNNVKRDAFENSFDSGNLTVNKEITGNYSDPNDVFEITVTITPIGDVVINASTIDWNTATENVSGPDTDGKYTAVYTLKGGESFTIQNIPYDVSYTVVETVGEDGKANGYDVEYDNNATGEMNAAAIETIITNTRELGIETGINLDNLPYILILVGAAVGLVAFTMKRRLSDDR